MAALTVTSTPTETGRAGAHPEVRAARASGACATTSPATRS